MNKDILTLRDLGLRVVYTWRDRWNQFLEWAGAKERKPSTKLYAPSYHEWESLTPLIGHFVTQRSTTPSSDDKSPKTTTFYD